MDKKQDNSVLEKIKNARNIIFDMDGTLVNTAKATIKAYQDTAVEFGLPVKEPDKITGLIGYPVPEFYYRMYPEVDRDILDRYGEAATGLEQKYVAELKEEILYPGVKELIEKLRANNCYLCIASTGSMDHVNTALGSSGIKSKFDVIKCNEDVKIDMVREIIANGPDGEWIMVGDRYKDLEAGRGSGITTVGAAYGFGTREEMEQFDIEIDSAGELLEILQI